MYKFKNVKKLLIEFSRGEGLSVPTDSIKFVKVDGDELSGATPGVTPGGSSDDVTVKSLMKVLLDRNEGFSDYSYNEPDAYYLNSEGDLVEIDTVETLISVLGNSDEPYQAVIFPAYEINATPEFDYYLSNNWNMVDADSVHFEPISDEYAVAQNRGIQ